jgi:2-dehydro-3-deoxyglucarate aldolase
MTNTILKKLKSGEPSIGTWLQISSPDVAEIIGNAGYEWVAVDLEHGGFSRSVLKDIFRALELNNTVPLARVAQCNPQNIKEALDAGAQGIILPMIESKAQLEDGISWSYYPPKGTRGVGYSRANLFGQNFDEYVKKFSSKVLIVAQIEHINAVANLDDILSVKDLDAIMVGPYDLSGSMGITAQFSHSEFIRTLDDIFQKARNHAIPMGLHIVQPDKELLADKIKQGYQFIAYGIDAVFLYNASKNPYNPRAINL